MKETEADKTKLGDPNTDLKPLDAANELYESNNTIKKGRSRLLVVFICFLVIVIFVILIMHFTKKKDYKDWDPTDYRDLYIKPVDISEALHKKIMRERERKNNSKHASTDKLANMKSNEINLFNKNPKNVQLESISQSQTQDEDQLIDQIEGMQKVKVHHDNVTAEQKQKKLDKQAENLQPREFDEPSDIEASKKQNQTRKKNGERIKKIKTGKDSSNESDLLK